MFLSIGARIEVNIEAFNAVETVGNLTKHRRAPMVVPTNAGYRLIYVPAVSGESIANAYQRNLVELAKHTYKVQGRNPPLTEWDLRHEFSKFMDNKHLIPELAEIVKEATSKKQEKKVSEDIVEIKHKFEKTAVEKSIVADVGGFLYAEDLPVKRTSRVYFGYLLPTYDTIETMAIEAQYHARQMPAETIASEARRTEQEAEGEEKRRRAAQMIYYVEVASAVYGLTAALDISNIGKTSLVRVEDAVSSEERHRRIKVAIGALAALFSGSGFGAKLSRFTPVKKVVSAVALISNPAPFMVTPPQYPNYIEDSILRAANYCKTLQKIGLTPTVTAIAMGGQPKEAECVQVVKANTIEELFNKVLEKTEELAESRPTAKG
ncbi:MAG: type I-A CRISPR-associated protein Cas7/Csa2 [Sulfolobales archaeon]